ncbi:MAG: hypothetical protein OEZ01_02760 [Candidatus Heimdallarchaeota archaeon]|nr:hypothetical protein [Candidatus Heimdallarchaeota archaeon]MDH5644898.1 hypothetical protein [Candidatus Heimdallarchaeota archaeon]
MRFNTTLLKLVLFGLLIRILGDDDIVLPPFPDVPGPTSVGTTLLSVLGLF